MKLSSYLNSAIDIVILNCNNEGYIQRLIKSIQVNTPEPYRIIVVDMNSTDGSREWLKDNEVASHLILNKMNLGCGLGRNQGLSATKNDWICFIDSDIEINDKYWLDKMWNYTIDRNVGFIQSRTYCNNKYEFSGLSCALIRKKCIDEVGWFDRKFLFFEDYDWYARLEWGNWKSAYCSDTDIIHLGCETVSKCFEGSYKEYEQKYLELLNHKYSSKMLDETLNLFFERRVELTKELLEV